MQATDARSQTSGPARQLRRLVGGLALALGVLTLVAALSTMAAALLIDSAPVSGAGLFIWFVFGLLPALVVLGAYLAWGGVQTLRRRRSGLKAIRRVLVIVGLGLSVAAVIVAMDNWRASPERAFVEASSLLAPAIAIALIYLGLRSARVRDLLADEEGSPDG